MAAHVPELRSAEAETLALFVSHHSEMNKIPHCLCQIFELMHAVVTRCFHSISITASVNH